MGLYINTGQHPDVYKTKAKIVEPNQGYFKKDYFTELANEQKMMHELFIKSFQEMRRLHEKQEAVQDDRWKEIGNQLNALHEKSALNESSHEVTINWLKRLAENDERLYEMYENRHLQEQEFIDQINDIRFASQELLHEMESGKREANTQLEELSQTINYLSEQLSDQSEKQTEVVIRLENQEALTEKVLRQMDYIRSVLFERASFLAEKMEESYQLTSSYIYKTITGSDKPLSVVSDRKEATKENK